MTTLFMDGFSHYGTTGAVANMLDGTYAAVDSGNFRVQCPTWDSSNELALMSHASNGGVCRRVFASTQSTLFWSLRFSIDSLPAFNNFVSVCDLRDNTNTVIFSLVVQSTGVVSVMNRTSGTVLAQTQGPIIVAQNWHLLELYFDYSTQTVTLRVDDAQGTGTPAINASGLTFGGSAAADQIGFLVNQLSGNNYPNTYMKDVFVRNASGSLNNSWIGDRRVATLFANADTVTSNWTPSYYREFGAGICTLSYIMANSNTVQNPSAILSTAAATSLDIGSSDFTIETFVRFDSLHTSGYSSIFSRWNATGNQRSYRLILGTQSFNGGCLQFDISTSGASGTIATRILYPWVPNLNTWYHVAIVRSSGELLLFVDGQQFGLPITDSATYFGGGSEVFSIGAETGTSGLVTGTNLIGRLDETRFTNGYGRYTGPFTPPSSAFTRGSGDPQWSQVVLLMGYDSAIIDESSFARIVTASGGAVAFQPADGAIVGVYSTVNKAIPDDNTFISASLTNASNIFTMVSQPSNTTTVTVGTKNGSTPAVYTFKTVIASAFDVLIDTTAQNTLINLYNAINAGAGIGTKYGAGTTVNFDVNAVQLVVGQIEALANVAGVAGNSIVSTSTSTGSWASATLTNGADIPGPTNFKLQRPPNNTTIISAMQMNFRALKTDSGTASVQSAFVAALGGVALGADHALTTAPNYYADIIETDPDTSSTITPTTIINGQFQVNRTA